MTASVSRPPAHVAPTGSTGMRVLVGGLGAATLIVGVVLLFDPVAAAHTLAVLIGLGLILGGLLELAVGWHAGHRFWASVLGAVLVIGGVLAAAWPKPTLFAVALVTGVTLIAHGAVRVGVALAGRDEGHRWGWLVVAGAVNIIAGVVAIVWPQATVLVLAVVLGAQIAAFGLLLLVVAFMPSGDRTGALDSRPADRTRPATPSG